VITTGEHGKTTGTDGFGVTNQASNDQPDVVADESTLDERARILRRAGAESSARLIHGDVTGAIIEAACEVHNRIGCGLLEKVYENALAWELHLRERKVLTQIEYRVIYRNKDVGLYYADMVVDDRVLVEIKSVDELTGTHRAQLMNYLRISGLRVGLLMNFARPRLKYERYAV
jgi:GxxExxY protein